MRLYQNLSFVFFSASLAAKVSGLSTKVSNNNSSHHLTSRRNWIGKLVTAASATSTLYITNPPSPAVAQQEVQELPIDLRRYTALAPLGDANTSTGNKLTGLSMESIASRLSHDLVDGSTGKGGYFISDVPKREITGRIRSGGVLKLPWNPHISSYE
eukprot:scaffold41882_cov183-Skeletonema_dohrnii-CCMP3373.AAC.1